MFIQLLYILTHNSLNSIKQKTECTLEATNWFNIYANYIQTKTTSTNLPHPHPQNKHENRILK